MMSDTYPEVRSAVGEMKSERDVFDAVLRETSAGSDLYSVLEGLPWGRILGAFVCGSCVSFGPERCLGDLERVHKVSVPWGQEEEKEDEHGVALENGDCNNDDDDHTGHPDQNGDDHRPKARGHRAHADSSLLGMCLRALLPPKAILSALKHGLLVGGAAGARPLVHSGVGALSPDCPLGQSPDASGRPVVLCLCVPSERDRRRMAALTLVNAVMTHKLTRWALTVDLSGRWWTLVCREPALASGALVVDLTSRRATADVTADAALMAGMHADVFAHSDNKSTKGGLNVISFPHVPYVRLCWEAPFWSDDRIQEVNVLINDDPRFAIVAHVCD